jgi:polyferredoxin
MSKKIQKCFPEERDRTGAGPRASKVSRIRAWALIGVHLVVALHLAHWFATGRTLSLIEPSEAMQFSKRSVINAGLVFFGAVILSTLLLGRFFCGWACHLVALQDLCRWLMLKVGITPRPLRSRSLAFVPFLAAGYMFFWPLAYRIWIEDDLSIRGNELYVQDIWSTMPGLWVGLATFAVCGFACVWFLGSKGFCTYACPYGAIFSVADKFAPGRIRVTDACEQCGHCTQTCSSNVNVAREVHEYGMVVDTNCMKCLDCVSVCPTNALYFGFGAPAVGLKSKQTRGKGWGEEVLLTLVFCWTFFSVRGIYDMVPFLFALGIAGCVAFFGLRCMQLITRPNVKLLNTPLKSAGKLQPGARWFLPASLLLLAGVSQSSWVQFHGMRSANAFATLAPVKMSWFTQDRLPVDEEVEVAAKKVLESGRLAMDAGLFSDPLRLMESAWAALILDDQEMFADLMGRAQEAAYRAGAPSVDLAHQAWASGDLDRATQLLALAVEIDPDLHQAWGELIELEAGRGHLDRAIAQVRSGLDQRPADGHLYDLLGSLYAAQGNSAAAQAALQKALTLEPRLSQPRVKLAQMLFMQGRPREAARLLREGLDLAPEDPALLNALSQLEAATPP